jgi:hypothetical protein
MNAVVAGSAPMTVDHYVAADLHGPIKKRNKTTIPAPLAISKTAAEFGMLLVAKIPTHADCQ